MPLPGTALEVAGELAATGDRMGTHTSLERLNEASGGSKRPQRLRAMNGRRWWPRAPWWCHYPRSRSWEREQRWSLQDSFLTAVCGSTCEKVTGRSCWPRTSMWWPGEAADILPSQLLVLTCLREMHARPLLSCWSMSLCGGIGPNGGSRLCTRARWVGWTPAGRGTGGLGVQGPHSDSPVPQCFLGKRCSAAKSDARGGGVSTCSLCFCFSAGWKGQSLTSPPIITVNFLGHPRRLEREKPRRRVKTKYTQNPNSTEK